MLNILIDLLPKCVEVSGKEFTIDSNFRASILFELMVQDNTLSDEEKIIQALEIYYGDNIPQDIPEAIDKILEFYRGGKEEIRATKGKGKSKNIQVYSYEHDSELIYSAFMRDYGIDLQDIKYLHWWKFKALFRGLSEDNEIVKAMRYRGIDLSTIKDKGERDHYRKLKEYYKLPVTKEEENRLEGLTEALLNGGDIKKYL